MIVKLWHINRFMDNKSSMNRSWQLEQHQHHIYIGHSVEKNSAVQECITIIIYRTVGACKQTYTVHTAMIQCNNAHSLQERYIIIFIIDSRHYKARAIYIYYIMFSCSMSSVQFSFVSVAASVTLLVYPFAVRHSPIASQMQCAICQHL